MKKLFSILTGLGLALVLLTSCEKNPESGSGSSSDVATVTGVLKDAETGKPMANTIVIMEMYYGVYFYDRTDAEGRFLFGHMPPRTQCLIIGVISNDERDYEIVYLAVDGQERDLDADLNEYWDIDEGPVFFLNAGQTRNLEVRVKEWQYED